MARKWITRDEIADIHEQRAAIAEREYAHLSMNHDLSAVDRLDMARVCLDKVTDCLITADEVREIDKVTPLIAEHTGSFTSLVRSGRSNW